MTNLSQWFDLAEHENEFSVDRLRFLLDYNKDTGMFVWKNDPKMTLKTKVGKVAGSVNNRGYWRIQIDRKTYQAHRLAWMYMHGKFPDGQIDHINRIKTDNRISNLRECTNAENAQNRPIQKNNKSGFIGVFWRDLDKKWVAQIKINGKPIRIGLFDNKIDAHNAYKLEKKKVHTFNPELKDRY